VAPLLSPHVLPRLAAGPPLRCATSRCACCAAGSTAATHCSGGRSARGRACMHCAAATLRSGQGVLCGYGGPSCYHASAARPAGAAASSNLQCACMHHHTRLECPPVATKCCQIRCCYGCGRLMVCTQGAQIVEPIRWFRKLPHLEVYAASRSKAIKVVETPNCKMMVYLLQSTSCVHISHSFVFVSRPVISVYCRAQDRFCCRN
jgi:hypothetical protein